jgi:hypothetical protein
LKTIQNSKMHLKRNSSEWVESNLGPRRSWVGGPLSFLGQNGRGGRQRWPVPRLKRLAGPRGTRSSAGHRAHGRTVVSSPVVRRWPGGSSVGTVSTSGARSSRRARRRQQSPTTEAVQRGAGEGGSARWRPTEEVASVDDGGLDGA